MKSFPTKVYGVMTTWILTCELFLSYFTFILSKITRSPSVNVLDAVCQNQRDFVAVSLPSPETTFPVSLKPAWPLTPDKVICCDFSSFLKDHGCILSDYFEVLATFVHYIGNFLRALSGFACEHHITCVYIQLFVPENLLYYLCRSMKQLWAKWVAPLFTMIGHNCSSISTLFLLPGQLLAQPSIQAFICLPCQMPWSSQQNCNHHQRFLIWDLSIY